MRFFVVLLCALLCTAASATEVYKWVDKDGVVHYGDQPKHDAEMIDVRTGSGGDEPAAADAAQAPTGRGAECQRKKAQLETYRRASTVKETDNLGRTREYTDQERQQLLAVTEKQVSEACAPPAP